MAGEEGVLELGQHGVVEPEDPVHEGSAPGDAGRGVAAELFVDRRGLPPRRPELAEGGGKVGRGLGREGRTHGAEPRRAAPGRSTAPCLSSSDRNVNIGLR